MKDKYRKTPLHVAIDENVAVAQLLLEKEADVKAKDRR